MRFGGAFSPWLLASFYGLLSVCLADDCVDSSDADYDYEVSASDDFTIHWTVDSGSEEISFKAIYSGTGWVGVGFSADGEMIDSDAVIGLPDNETVLEYNLAGKSVASVTESTTPEISNESIVQEGGKTTLVFTRPLSPTDSSKISLSSEEGEEAIFIWGAGGDNILEEHAHEGSVTVTDIFCSGSAAATKDECSSSDPEFEFEVTPSSGLTLFWSVVENDTAVSVKAVYEGEGWLGIGFSDSGSMIGSDAVVGLPDEGTVLEYDMDAHDTPSESAEQEISNATITQVDGVTTLTFVRPLGPSGDRKQFYILWSQLLALTPELGKAQSKDPHEAVVDIAQARFLLGELDLVAQDTALHRERVIIQELSTDLSHVLIYKKPGLACAFLHRRLHSVSAIKHARLLKKVQDDLRDITAVGGKQDFPTLADWQPYSTGGGAFSQAPAGPRSASRSVRGRGVARRVKANNGGSSRPSMICGKCSTAGQPSNHSHRVCPLTECFKCHQKGHVIQNCPN